SERLKTISKDKKIERRLSHACILPPLICNEIDFKTFELSELKPNYIGKTRVSAMVANLDNIKQSDMNVEGCIALIPQAEPGYDWLFAKNIAGLITLYGGANSHMAIRSAEFGIPAAIGVGEKVYLRIMKSNSIELDPANEVIRVLN